MHCYRSDNCGELNQVHVGKVVKIAGWVKNIRNHGAIVFIDLRDHYGVRNA